MHVEPCSYQAGLSIFGILRLQYTTSSVRYNVCMGAAKTLARLRGRPCWSVSSLDAYAISTLTHFKMTHLLHKGPLII